MPIPQTVDESGIQQNRLEETPVAPPVISSGNTSETSAPTSPVPSVVRGGYMGALVALCALLVIILVVLYVKKTPESAYDVPTYVKAPASTTVEHFGTVFSEDGKHSAYVVEEQDGITIYRDQEVFRSYPLPPGYRRIPSTGDCADDFRVHDLYFTPNNTLVYIRSNFKEQPNDGCLNELFVGGEAYDASSFGIDGPIAGNGRGDIAYITSGPSTPIEGTDFDGGDFFLTVNRQRQRTFSFPGQKIHALQFSKDGNTLCYVLGSAQSPIATLYGFFNGKVKALSSEDGVDIHTLPSQFCPDQSN